jgi:hypothetical protein
MRTTIPLSREDKRLIAYIQKTAISASIALLVIGGFITVAGFIITEWMIGCFIVGSIFLFAGIAFTKHSYSIVKREARLHEKDAVTGILQRVQNLGDRKLRYHFNGFYIDALLELKTTANYDIRKIAVQIWLNREVTLHTIELASNEVFLLQVFYDPHSPGREELLPLVEGDKNKMLSRPGFRFPLFVLIVLFTLIFTATGLTQALPFTIAPIVIIIPWLIGIAKATNKWVLSVYVTEKIDIRINSSRYARYETWYRLSNGEIQNLERGDLLLGEIITLTYSVKKDGSRGQLISVKRQ